MSRQLMQHPAPGVGAAMQICGLFAFGKGTLLQVVLEWHPLRNLQDVTSTSGLHNQKLSFLTCCRPQYHML